MIWLNNSNPLRLINKNAMILTSRPVVGRLKTRRMRVNKNQDQNQNTHQHTFILIVKLTQIKTTNIFHIWFVPKTNTVVKHLNQNTAWKSFWIIWARPTAVQSLMMRRSLYYMRIMLHMTDHLC